jgi:hypothetical protein
VKILSVRYGSGLVLVCELRVLVVCCKFALGVLFRSLLMKI